MRNLKYRHLATSELLAIESVEDFHNPELIAEICERAGLSDALEASHGDSSADGGETFESVLCRAVEILESRDATDI